MGSVVSAIKSTWITFACPICEFENRCRLAAVARQESVLCRGCHVAIQLVDKDAGASRTFRRVSSAFHEIRRLIERL